MRAKELLLTLAEPTPVHDATELQDDIERALAVVGQASHRRR